MVHLSENAGRYFQPSGGSLSGDDVDLARLELRFELRSALHRFFEQRQSTLSLPIMGGPGFRSLNPGYAVKSWSNRVSSGPEKPLGLATGTRPNDDQ